MPGSIIDAFTGRSAKKARRSARAERDRLRQVEEKRTKRLKEVQKQRSLADLASQLFGRDQLKRKKKGTFGNTSKVSGDS